MLQLILKVSHKVKVLSHRDIYHHFSLWIKSFTKNIPGLCMAMTVIKPSFQFEHPVRSFSSSKTRPLYSPALFTMSETRHMQTVSWAMSSLPLSSSLKTKWLTCISCEIYLPLKMSRTRCEQINAVLMAFIVLRSCDEDIPNIIARISSGRLANVVFWKKKNRNWNKLYS